MSAKPKVFNPFGGSASGAQNPASSSAKEAEKKPYPTTGVSARDQVRKMVFETFTGEGHSEADAAKLSESIESALTAIISDPKSRQYRDKARQIQLKLKGPRQAESRQQIVSGELGADTVCSDEWLKASASGPGAPRSMSRPGARPRAAPPGQHVRPRGPPGMVRPAGFRPVAPRQVTPIRAPAIQKPVRQEATQDETTTAEVQQINDAPLEVEEPAKMMESEQTEQSQSVDQPSSLIPEIETQKQKDHINQPEMQALTQPQPNHHNEPSQAQQSPRQSAISQVQLNDIAERTSESSKTTKDEAINQMSQNETNPQPFTEQVDQNVATVQQQIEARQDDDGLQVGVSLDTSGIALGDVSAISGFSTGAGKKKGKKSKKKKKVVKISKNNDDNSQLEISTQEVQQQPNFSDVNESSQNVEQSSNIVAAVEQHVEVIAQPAIQIVSEPVLAPVNVVYTSPRGGQQQINTPFEQTGETIELDPQMTKQPDQIDQSRTDFAQNSQEESKSHYFGVQQQEQLPLITSVEQSNDHQSLSPQVADKSKPQHFDSFHHTPPPQDRQSASPTHSPMMSSSNRPLQLANLSHNEDVQLPTSSSTSYTELLLSEVKQLREDARKARFERNQFSQALDQAQGSSQSENLILKAELKQKEVLALSQRKQLQHALDEADQYKQRLQKAHVESQRFRESMEEQMRNALQRMQHQNQSQQQQSVNVSLPSQNTNSSISQQIPASGVVMSSSSQGQGTSPHGAHDQELQKEIQTLRSQCQNYELQLQERNHDLQMRTKELQRVERQNITLSEQNKKLSDSLGELQNQNLSTIAGSGSSLLTSQLHNPANFYDNSSRQGGSQHMQPAQMMQSHQLGGSSSTGLLHQSATSSAQMMPVGGIADQMSGANNQGANNNPINMNAIVAGGASNNPHHNLSSGGPNMHLMNQIESGDADDGGRDGETRYFNDVTQDEGTGGESYTQQQMLINHHHHHEAIPQSSSGISGGQQFLNHHHSGAGASGGNVSGHHHQTYSSGVPGMQNSGGASLPNGSSGSGRQHQYLVGTASAGGDYIDGSYGQLPEGHDENSDSNDSEPENHRDNRDQDHNDQDDGEEEGYDYEFIGVGNQAIPSQAEMDVGGVHNETGDEAEDDEEDDHRSSQHQQPSINYNNITLIPSSALNSGNDNSMAGGGRSQNNQSSMEFASNNHYPNRGQVEDDQIGDVEDGSRGEEGGCRESNYAEEEIEQSISGNLCQDAPELTLHPQTGTKPVTILQPSNQSQPLQISADNGSSNYQATAGGVVETGRRKPPSQASATATQASQPASSGQRSTHTPPLAYEEEEGGEDTYDQHHHGGNEMQAADSNNHEFTVNSNGIGGHHHSTYEEEEKGDNAGGQMRAPKSTAMILGEDHGSKGNNQQQLSGNKGGGSGGNLQSASGLVGANGGNSGQSSAIQGQSQSAGVGGPTNNIPSTTSQSNQQNQQRQGIKGGGGSKIQLGGVGAAAPQQQKLQHHYYANSGQSSQLPQQNSSQGSDSATQSTNAAQTPATMPYPNQPQQQNQQPDESSNGGASVSCQPQTNAVVVASAQIGAASRGATSTPQTQASVGQNNNNQQPGSRSSPEANRQQVMGVSQISSQQSRNPRRGNKQQFQPHNSTNKPRQGGSTSTSVVGNAANNPSNQGRHQQHQTSQQSNRNPGGRNQRGKQSFNQQQQQIFTNQTAPTGEQSSQSSAIAQQQQTSGVTSNGNNQQQMQPTGQTNQAASAQVQANGSALQAQPHMVSGNIQSQAMMLDAPSSQASATGSLMFLSQQNQQRQKSFSGSGSQRNNQQVNSSDLEERKNGMGPPNANEFGHFDGINPSGVYPINASNGVGVGNAQSSSMASGGHQSTMMQSSQSTQPANANNPQSSSNAQSSGGMISHSKLQQMPASHASATVQQKQQPPSGQREASSVANPNNPWQGSSSQQNQGSKLNFMINQSQTYQAAQAAVNQQKGVVHTPGQSAQSQQPQQISSNGVPAPQSAAQSQAQQMNGLAGSGQTSGSGIIPGGISCSGNSSSQQLMQSSGSTMRVQSQEIMNAESGSTAFTNQRSMLSQSAFHRQQHDQSQSSQQQTQRAGYSAHNQQQMVSGLKVTSSPSHHAQVSSPPSSSQTGGGGSNQPGASQTQTQQMSSGSEHLHQEAASAGGGGDTDYYVAAVGAPPSSRAATMHQNMVDGGSSNSRQQLGQGVSVSPDTSASVSMQNQQQNARENPSGQSYMGHQRQSALANNAQKQSSNGIVGAQASSGLPRYNSIQGVFSSSGGGADQQSLQSRGLPFLSGSGEQEDQPSSNSMQHQYLQSQFGVGGSAASAGGAGSAANEAAINSSHSYNVQHMMGSGGQSSTQPTNAQQTTIPTNSQQDSNPSSQQMLMQGSSQSQASPVQNQSQNPQQPLQSAPPSNANMQPGSGANNSASGGSQQQTQQLQAQQQQHQQQIEDDRKTSGANTPTMGGADTPPYRDQQNQMPHIAQLYNLTSRKLQVIQNQEERARPSSATRETNNNSGSQNNTLSNTETAPPGLFDRD